MTENSHHLSIDKLANATIQAVQPYIPGMPVAELQRKYGLSRISKLASNENPLGASPRVNEAIRAFLPEISRYPDGSGYELRHQLANFWQVDSEQILLGNGSNEVLELVARTFAGPGDEIVYSQYAFAVYAISTQIVGATAVEVPAREYGHDLDAMLEAITDKTKIVYIANPNNPTGTVFDKNRWHDFIRQVPQNVLVVLDEAYIEYAQSLLGTDYPDAIADLTQYPNLLITRTFSKAYGLASLRIGALVASPEIIGLMNRIREPFNVNAMAQIAACAALKDQDFIARSLEVNQQGMAQISSFLKERSIGFIPSYGNFITVDFSDRAAEINAALLKQGVIVRPQGGYGMAEFLRISIGNYEENSHFLEALDTLF